MSSGPEAEALATNLIAATRLESKPLTRIFICAEHPNIPASFFDECQITIVHGFTSRYWPDSLSLHLEEFSGSRFADDSEAILNNRCNEITKLRNGEALIFVPNAVVGIEKKRDHRGSEKVHMKKLGPGHLKVKIRLRVTAGGEMIVLEQRPEDQGLVLRGNIR